MDVEFLANDKTVILGLNLYEIFSYHLEIVELYYEQLSIIFTTS